MNWNLFWLLWVLATFVWCVVDLIRPRNERYSWRQDAWNFLWVVIVGITLYHAIAQALVLK